MLDLGGDAYPGTQNRQWRRAPLPKGQNFTKGSGSYEFPLVTTTSLIPIDHKP